MEALLNKEISGNKLELLIDKNIFSKDIVLKTAYNFLDRGYFFFKLDDNDNIIIQFTKRDDNKEKIEDVVGDFSDSLLETYLRNKLEIDNKVIREVIVTKAINGPLDTTNFISLDTSSKQSNTEKNKIDFDKDIDQILKEIESDPELQIDEKEIENILKEIEEEEKLELEKKKPMIQLDTEAFKNMKNNFKK